MTSKISSATETISVVNPTRRIPRGSSWQDHQLARTPASLGQCYARQLCRGLRVEGLALGTLLTYAWQRRGRAG